MTDKDKADIKVKCLEIAKANNIHIGASAESILNDAKKLYEWVLA